MQFLAKLPLLPFSEPPWYLGQTPLIESCRNSCKKLKNSCVMKTSYQLLWLISVWASKAVKKSPDILIEGGARESAKLLSTAL